MRKGNGRRVVDRGGCRIRSRFVRDPWYRIGGKEAYSVQLQFPVGTKGMMMMGKEGKNVVWVTS